MITDEQVNAAYVAFHAYRREHDLLSSAPEEAIRAALEAAELSSAARIAALEAALKPFADLAPVSWSLEGDMYYIDTDDVLAARAAIEGKE